VVTSSLQAVHLGKPDLAISLASVGRDAAGNKIEPVPLGSFFHSDVSEADCFLRTHPGQAFRCPDGDFVDQTRMQRNLSTIHQVIREHLEGTY
jgi:hypothetical protein